MNNNNEFMQAIWAVQANRKGRGTEAENSTAGTNWHYSGFH